MHIRSVLLVLAGLSVLFIASTALAAGNCPESADSLQGYAGCMAQVRGGAVLRGSGGYGANLDADHRALLSAMGRNDGMPPQVMPVAPVTYPLLFSPYSYIYAGANPYIWASASVPYAFFSIYAPYLIVR
ncbi:MAG: hypothetical protein V2A66_01350 [Pseudomonadota bacterium]